MVTLVDYGMGNLRSVAKAFEVCGSRVRITSDPKDILAAEKIVLPGVGAFGAAISELKKRKLVRPIREAIEKGVPYLGLCLGLQLLFETSEEGAAGKKVKGFGIIPGSVKKFKGNFKIPHMGWNTVRFKKKGCPLFRGVGSGAYFYFVHSYYALPKDRSVLSADTSYGGFFCSALWKDNIYATQFHPEKSQAAGLRIIKNFIAL